jgi:hypothetical protein
MTSTPTQNEPGKNSVSLRLANGPLAGPVLSRVVSMVLARADCPVNRLDDAMILCDALTAAHANEGYVALTVVTDGREIQLRVRELSEQGATKLLADAAVPGIGNVLERLSDELRIESSSTGHPREELILTLHFD